MRRIHKFLRLTAQDQRLWIEALFLLSAIRLGLWLVSFQWLRHRVTRLAHALQATGRPGVDRLVWSVRSASRYVPAATCLTQALALQILLGRWGHAANVQIGFVTSAAAKLAAHAWVECQGEVVLGGPDLERYVPLLALAGKRPK